MLTVLTENSLEEIAKANSILGSSTVEQAVLLSGRPLLSIYTFFKTSFLPVTAKREREGETRSPGMN